MMIIAIATMAIHIQKGNITLSPMPIPSASRKSPSVFRKAPMNTFIPPLTNELKYYTIFTI